MAPPDAPFQIEVNTAVSVSSSDFNPPCTTGLSRISASRLLAVWKDISQHCVNQSGYIMTASLDGKDHLVTNYLISI